jgi:protein-S-isoprenylcysteine O-methyltransferase Ste14
MIILSILVTLLIPLIAFMVIPYLFISFDLAVWPQTIGVWQIIAILLILLGVSLAIKSTLVPFKSPKKFMASGPYTFSRNPMYVAMLVVLVGEALLLQAPWLLVFTAVIFLLFYLFVKVDEEPRMIQRFGASYQDYMKKVPRWLSPKRIE